MQTICDTDYWMRAGLYATVHTIPHALSTFRYHPGSKTLYLEHMKGSELIRAYNNLYAHGDLPATVLSIKGRAYSFCYLEAARYAYRLGERQLCWHHLGQSSVSQLATCWRQASLRRDSKCLRQTPYRFDSQQATSH